MGHVSILEGMSPYIRSKMLVIPMRPYRGFIDDAVLQKWIQQRVSIGGLSFTCALILQVRIWSSIVVVLFCVNYTVKSNMRNTESRRSKNAKSACLALLPTEASISAAF